MDRIRLNELKNGKIIIHFTESCFCSKLQIQLTYYNGDKNYEQTASYSADSLHFSSGPVQLLP